MLSFNDVSLDALLVHTHNSEELELIDIELLKNDWINIKFRQKLFNGDVSMLTSVIWYIPFGRIASLDVEVRILQLITEEQEREYELQLNAKGLSLELDRYFIAVNVPQCDFFYNRISNEAS